MLRAWANMRATVCSAAETMLDCGAFTSARSPRASSGRTSTWKSLRNSSRPRSDSGSVTRTRMGLRRGREDVLGGGHGRAPLDRVAQLVQRELDGGQAADHV